MNIQDFGQAKPRNIQRNCTNKWTWDITCAFMRLFSSLLPYQLDPELRPIRVLIIFHLVFSVANKQNIGNDYPLSAAPTGPLTKYSVTSIHWSWPPINCRRHELFPPRAAGQVTLLQPFNSNNHRSVEIKREQREIPPLNTTMTTEFQCWISIRWTAKVRLKCVAYSTPVSVWLPSCRRSWASISAVPYFARSLRCPTYGASYAAGDARPCHGRVEVTCRRGLQGGPQKTGTLLYAITSYVLSSSNIDRLSNLFHSLDQNNVWIIMSLKIPAHLKCFATLPTLLLRYYAAVK